MNIRTDCLTDDESVISTLAEWHYNAFSEHNPVDSIERRITWLKKQVGSKQIPITVVAFSEGIPLGSASLVAHDMETRQDLSPWLATVCVAPEYRKKGVGSALVEKIVEKAKKLGIKTLYLFTWDREKMYARLGWSVFERTEYHGEQVVIMSIQTGT
ncbi:MAG: GNAT family N-acetyltransferase [Deltaproteobacteria bacterium]|nr:GNAT family N-acetyltransferase [Deltaproteobacteria bacterium]MBW2052809.1 GNAT family N-acetyltransferase [Deltaproteobacteria bacterium]MBW2141801.1 GNAT family N-acetyltransferase [Deltaproteobacteria bacterium]MBW2324482.1 GNAT family N-acetyltransferase [Deltaproteobacteria bacterium]